MESPKPDSESVGDSFGFWQKPQNIIGMSILGVIAALVLLVGYMLDNPAGEPPTIEEQQRNQDMGQCLDSGQTVEECANPALNP